MKFIPTKITNVTLFLFAILIHFSCSKDSDLMTEYISLDENIQNVFLEDFRVQTLLNESITINPSEEGLENLDVTDPSMGTATVNDDGSITYTPDQDETGTDEFNYSGDVTNADNSTTSGSGTVIVNVADCTLGSACMTPDTSCFDPSYPEIQEFVKAGVTGGIPIDLPIFTTINPGANLQATINACNAAGGGVIILNEGTYPITSHIQMKSNVVLRGVERYAVILECTIRQGRSGNTANAAFKWNSGVSYSGIEDLTYKYRVDGCEPPDGIYDPTGKLAPNSTATKGVQQSYAFQDNPCGMTNLYVPAFYANIGSINNWIDNCDIIETGWNPVDLRGTHFTVSNSKIWRAYNKYSITGYFRIFGSYNLVANNEIMWIRHILFGGRASNAPSKFNVLYNNSTNVDINFHSGDDGYNLVERNTSTIPPWAHKGGVPVQTGWSKNASHDPIGPNNLVYNNDFSGAARKTTTVHSSYPDIGQQNKVFSMLEGTWIDDPGHFFEIKAKPPPNCGTFYPMKSN